MDFTGWQSRTSSILEIEQKQIGTPTIRSVGSVRLPSSPCYLSGPVVLPLQKLIHLHSESDCESDNSDWDNQPSEEKKASRQRKNKTRSLLSKVTKPFRSRRSTKEPPKSRDTTADLNGYIDAHKSPSVEAPITRVSACGVPRSHYCACP